MALHDDDPSAGRPEGDATLDVSRRAFLKTVSASSIAAGVIAPGGAAAQGPAAAGPGKVPIRLTIDGQTRSLEVEPRVTLLDAMRERLDVTAQKRVCDRGSCGACTVLLDGKTAYACTLLAIDVQGRAIKTVASLAQGTVLHPVQQAFCDHDGLMCGFCTPGFVLSAVTLLEKKPNPTAEQARAALDGNICRCGTYPRVVEAVLNTKGVRRG
jgi:aerobic-type carbon monoxide dehydrogenase small subunit (CoxS/CutS family)